MITSPEAAVLAALALFAATFVFEDGAIILGAEMISRGTVGFQTAWAALSCGIACGDLALYGAGRLARRWPRLAQFADRHAQRGLLRSRERLWGAMLMARFIPGSRLPVFLAVGLLRAPFAPALVVAFVASAFWTAATLAFGARFLSAHPIGWLLAAAVALGTGLAAFGWRVVHKRLRKQRAWMRC